MFSNFPNLNFNNLAQCMYLLVPVQYYSKVLSALLSQNVPVNISQYVPVPCSVLFI